MGSVNQSRSISPFTVSMAMSMEVPEQPIGQGVGRQRAEIGDTQPRGAARSPAAPWAAHGRNRRATPSGFKGTGETAVGNERERYVPAGLF